MERYTNKYVNVLTKDKSEKNKRFTNTMKESNEEKRLISGRQQIYLAPANIEVTYSSDESMNMIELTTTLPAHMLQSHDLYVIIQY